jgi:hypothetical protein
LAKENIYVFCGIEIFFYIFLHHDFIVAEKMNAVPTIIMKLIRLTFGSKIGQYVGLIGLILEFAENQFFSEKLEIGISVTSYQVPCHVISFSPGSV